MEVSTGRTLSKSTSGLRMIPCNELSSSPFALEEPAWIPDKEVTKCLGCEKSFDFFNRRHHCRRCGRCYCSNCCGHVLRLHRMYFVDPVRHCYDCAILTKAEEDFYDEGLEILFNGRQFNIQDKGANGDLSKDVGAYLCRLSSDHRIIHFTPSKPLPNGSQTPHKVQLTHVTEVRLIAGSKQSAGGESLKIYYKDDENVNLTYCIQLYPVDERSYSWLKWANKALLMTVEARGQKVHD